MHVMIEFSIANVILISHYQSLAAAWGYFEFIY